MRLREDDEDRTLQDGQGVRLCDEPDCRQSGVRDVVHQRVLRLRAGVILVVQDHPELVHDELGCSPALLKDGLSVPHIRKGFLLLDWLTANLAIVVERRDAFVEVDPAEKVKVTR